MKIGHPDRRGRMNLRPGRSLELRIGESAHRMASNLRDLGLHNAHPLIVLDTHRFQSRLNAGVAMDRIATGVTGATTVTESATLP